MTRMPPGRRASVLVVRRRDPALPRGPGGRGTHVVRVKSRLTTGTEPEA
jgi:hypothetical protein